MTIQELLAESSELERIGAQVQGDQVPGLSPDEISTFVDRYQHFYAACMAALPPDLRQAFQSEFQGAWHSQKIRAFIEAPTEASPFAPKAGEVPPPPFSYWLHPFDRQFRAPLLAQRLILLEAEKRSAPAMEQTESAILIIQRVCERFPSFLVPLRDRTRSDHPPIIVSDEYDVQDFLQGIFRIFFDDVRPEDQLQRRAGASTRPDFALRNEGILIEVKMTRIGRGVKEIGDELILDISRYEAATDYDALVAFVYDPGKLIKNTAELTSDLSGTRGRLRVLVIVAQG